MTDIDKVLADHRESTMPAWKGACAADGDDFPCLEYRLASELEAARKVVGAGHDWWKATEQADKIAKMSAFIQSMRAYDRVMEEQR